MNPASEDIKDILTADSSTTVATFATDLFISELPASPDLCISLYDQGSWKPPEVNFDQEYPILQVLVRGTVSGYTTAYELAEDIYDVLHTMKNTTKNSTFYISITAATSIMYIGRDEKNRPLFSTNYHIIRRPV